MTPDVTVFYYSAINRVARARLGRRCTAPIYVYSADLETMIQHATAEKWSEIANVYLDPINALTSGTGDKRVDGVVICAILAHKVSAQLSQALAPLGIPLLHISDFVSAHLKSRYPGVTVLGFLAPKNTMLDDQDPDFFIGRLQRDQSGFVVLVPDTMKKIEEVHNGIVNEVAKGRDAVSVATKAMFIEQARELVCRGAQAILLGSTDLGFIIDEGDFGKDIPVIEPAALHAEGAAEWALRH